MTRLLLTFALAVLPQADEKPILEAIEKLKSPESAERRAAGEKLRQTGADAVPLILKTLENEHPGLADRVKELVGRLSNKDWKERDAAMKSLVGLGRDAMRLLQEHENAADPEVAWRVKAALAEIQETAGTEEQRDQARNALLCEVLGDVGDARCVKTLLKTIASPTAELKLKGVEALSKLHRHLSADQAGEVADKIQEMIMSEKQVLRKSLLVKALGPLKSPGSVTPLVGLLVDKTERNVNLKRNVMAALAEIGDPKGIKAIIRALVDEEVYLRHGASSILGGLAGETFGYDPMAADDENKPALEKFRKWWEKKFGKEWED